MGKTGTAGGRETLKRHRVEHFRELGKRGIRATAAKYLNGSIADAMEYLRGCVLRIVPITLAEANGLVSAHHRHHKPVPGYKFAIAVAEDEVIRGAAIVGRPVARMLDNGWTLEVNRLATDGARNACSMLYRASWRAAKALGCYRLLTFTLPEEGGASLRASSWRLVGERGGGSWSPEGRPRVDTHPLQRKLLWEAVSMGQFPMIRSGPPIAQERPTARDLLFRLAVKASR